MTRPKKLRFVDAPMAVTSAGTVLLNATHLRDGASVADFIDIAKATRRPIFIGVEVETSRELLRWIDDAAAEIVGAIGGPIVSGVASASGRSSEATASAHRGRGADRAPRPRDRRREP